MSVVDSSYLLVPRKRPDLRPSYEEWRPRSADVADSDAADRSDPLRTVTFYAALSLVFIKFGMIQEIQPRVMGFNAYLLYIFFPPVALGILVSGGVRRTMAVRTAWYWVAFTVWMVICVPFSSWRIDSLMLAKSYIRDDLLMMFAIAGLVLSWRDCRLLLKAIGVAAVIGVLAGRMFASVDGGRLGLDFGTVSNPNDYAAHLLLVLPLLLLFVFNSRRFVVRFAAILIVCIGILMILRTASRGALIALGVCALFTLVRGGAFQRVALLCLTPVIFAAVLAFVPAEALQRIVSFSSSDRQASQEALESTDARRYVLQKGIEYTLKFPLFGVGPGQFPAYEGNHNKVYGSHGMWHQAHNAWVQASSECGIPGAIFLISGYVSTFLLVNRTFRKTRHRADCRDIRNTAFCVMLGMVGFGTAISFLNFAYFFYGPALAGLAISLNRAADYELKHRGALTPTVLPPVPKGRNHTAVARPAVPSWERELLAARFHARNNTSL